MKSVQDWPGASIPVRSFGDFRDLAVLIGGPDPAADPNAWYSAQHHQHARGVYAGSGVEEFLPSKSIVFVDSITDLTRQAMVYAKQQPEAFSERTGKPDVRGAYGLLGREVIQALKHLQHAPGKTVIFVGVLEKVTDEFNVTLAAADGGLQGGARTARHRRPGDLDAPVRARRRGRLRARREGHRAPAGLPRRQPVRPAGQGPLRPPRHDRAARPRRAARQDQPAFEPARSACRMPRARSFTPPDPITAKEKDMYDLNDAQPQMPPVGELIPDGTFAKVNMTIRPGGMNGATPMDAGLLKASHSSDAKLLDCEFTVVEGPYARRKFWQNFTVAGGKLDEKGQSKGWNISKSAFRAMIDSALGLDPKDESAAAKAEAGDPGAEAARRHRLCRAHHGRAGVGPAIQGRQQARQRRDAGRAAVRSRHARRERAARTGQRQAAQAPTPPSAAPAWGTPTPPPAPAGGRGPARRRTGPAPGRSRDRSGWLNT